MALYELLLPKMGESVAEATIIKWLKKPGDTIEPDDAVVEIATDKVDSEVPSPVKGKFSKVLFSEDQVVQVGDVIALIEMEVEETEIVPQPATPPVTVLPEKTSVKEVLPEKEPVKKAPAQIPGLEFLQPKNSSVSASNSIRFYSPLVRSIAAQENIVPEELDQISGSGSEGRLTKDDLLNYLQQKSVPKNDPQQVSTETEKEPEPQINQPKPEPQKKTAELTVSGGDEIIEMDRMRKMIADHMVISKQTSPHVTSFIETDVTDLVHWREKHKTAFEKREGEKITFTPIFVEAVAKALKDMPMVNVSLNGTQIIRKKNINIGMA
ncbi:MAG: 2-oxo acid dehydrogenase subunit E2, partial [Janthinobacterium lividum]